MRKLPEVLSRLFKASQKGFIPHHFYQSCINRIGLIKSGAGFTLIELLVVIGILGILISAMVATIDPFEQIKKGSDSNLKNISAEFVNGNIRYYTTQLKFPWDAAPADACTIVADTPTLLSTPAMTDCINSQLVTQGELKSGFSSVAGLDKIYVTVPSGVSNTRVIACFVPTSKGEQKATATKFNQNGTLWSGGGTCKSAGGAADCYWCTE